MNCERFLSLIDDFTDSALPNAERHEMRTHLAECRKCCEEMRALESLLARSATITEIPDRDLWPQVAAGIAAAGAPENAPVGNASTRIRGSFQSKRRLRWIWRFAAVAILGGIVLLAATYLHRRPAVPPSNTSGTPVRVANPARNAKTPVPVGQIQTGGIKAAEGGSPVTGEGNYAQACQCSPGKEISDIIDNAWMVDPKLSPQRAREIVSEKLYDLAGQNADNFFLHRAALDARQFPVRAGHNLTQRYRQKLDLQPHDPVWTYFYAYSLFGKDTPEMIRSMRQLTMDHPEFPWSNLVLAEVYGLFGYKDEDKVRSSLEAFMRLCPNNPEPVRLLVALKNSDFLADAIGRMRSNLATHIHIQSLLLYQHLWYLEAIRGATGEDGIKVQQRIREDLKRLQRFEGSRSGQLAEVIRGGYLEAGDRETFRDLFNKDTSSSGRWGAVMLEMQEWDRANPAPSNNAPAGKRAAYWENRLRMSESWINKMPENPSLWIIKLEALAALTNHSESEFIEAAANVLALEREGPETPELGSHLNWKSNVLKLASLFAQKGLYLDQVPDLIREGYAVAERNRWQNATDLSANPQWALLMGRFSVWLEADDAWYSLTVAYLRAGRADKANTALNNIEAGLQEFRNSLAQAQANANPDDTSIVKLQRQGMADQLSLRESRYSAARASARQTARK